MQEAYEYAAPQRETFFEYVPGQEKNTDLFDDTAINGLQTFANRMQKAIVPPWQQWSLMVPGAEVENEDAEVKYRGKQMPLSEALKEVNDLVFDYIHRSNFSSRAYESFIDLGISTGTLTCEYNKDRDELLFNAVPLPQLFLSSGPNGEVSDHWREHDVELGLLLRMWPDAQLDDKTKQDIAKKPGSKVGVIEGAIYHEGEYYYVVILAKSKKIIFSQDEGEVGPFISFRGMVVPGEVYGRGPIMQVLTSIKTLNVINEFELTSAALAASGAWTGRDDGIFDPYNIQVIPGMIIPVSTNETGNPTIAALPMNFDHRADQVLAEKLEKNINRALFAEPLGSIDDPTKTLGEIQIRYQMHLEDAGAFFARLQTELVERVMKRVVYVLQKEGVIPPLVLDGKDVKIKHTSPIARVMDTEDIQNLQTAIQATSMLGEEAVMATYNIEKVGPYIAKKQGIDPELLYTDAERAQMKEQMAQAAQAMAEQEGG